MSSEYVSEEGGGSDPAQREKSRQAGREGNPLLGKMLPKSLATTLMNYTINHGVDNERKSEVYVRLTAYCLFQQGHGCL